MRILKVNQALILSEALMKYLKEQNNKLLWVFIAMNAAVFLTLLSGNELSMSAIERQWGKLMVKGGVVAALVPIITTVLNGLLSSTIKAQIVFGRLNNPLPGCRAFSKIGPADERVNMDILREKHGPLPSVPDDQNTLWYSLMRKNDQSVVIQNSHKLFLLTRDLTSLSVLFIVPYPLGLILSTDVAVLYVVYYLRFLLLQYLVMARVASVYGKRFVGNVLAEESI